MTRDTASSSGQSGQPRRRSTVMNLEGHDSPVTPGVLDIIIIVDDSEDNAEMLSELLIERGHRVRIAPNGASALELLGKDVADVVLLDVGLPDMDGYEVAEFIRGRFRDRVRIIALTGFSGTRAREQARRSGFDAYLVKPFHIEDVETVLVGGRRDA